MSRHFQFTPAVLLVPFFFVMALWLSFWAEVRFHLDFSDFGVYPRTFSGLAGVVLSPFIHGNAEHLYNNSLPLLVLLAALVYFYRSVALKVIVYGILISGLITWLIGRESHHIGASGLVYVLVSFIFFKGIITRYYRLVAVSLLAVFLYGSMIWYVFPDIEQGISWEGHLGGLIAGFAFAVMYKTPEFSREYKYEWERPDFDPSQDKFMQRFDENGNFVNPPKPEPEEDPQDTPRIVYHYREADGSEDSRPG